MNRLKKMGAHKIIQAYFIGFILWIMAAGKSPGEWMGLWVFVLALASVILLLLVVFGDVGSTWNDKE